MGMQSMGNKLRKCDLQVYSCLAMFDSVKQKVNEFWLSWLTTASPIWQCGGDEGTPLTIIIPCKCMDSTPIMIYHS